MTLFRPSLGSRAVSVFVIVCSIIMVFDSIIVAVYMNLRVEPDRITTLRIFFGLVIFYVIMSYVLLSQSNSYQLIRTSKIRSLNLIHLTALIIQLTIIAILSYIALDLTFEKDYLFSSVVLATNIAYSFGLICLSVLFYAFIRWSKLYRSLVIILYATGFSIMIVYLFTSLILLNYEFSFAPESIKVRSIKIQIADSSNTLINHPLLYNAYNYLTIASFLIIWTATVMQLKTTMKHFGNVKYWGALLIALVYFLFPILANQFDIFDNLRLGTGSQFDIVYLFIISPYKQIGGLLFGLVFWIAAKGIKRENLVYSMFISGVGMILIFNSTVIHDVTYLLAPPFGIISLLFTGIASYLLLTGIFVSSKILAEDTFIRSEVYKIVENERSFLKNIGMAETQRVLERRIKPILKQTLPDEIEETELRSDEDYKEIIREVINELKSNKKKP